MKKKKFREMYEEKAEIEENTEHNEEKAVEKVKIVRRRNRKEEV